MDVHATASHLKHWQQSWVCLYWMHPTKNQHKSAPKHVKHEPNSWENYWRYWREKKESADKMQWRQKRWPHGSSLACRLRLSWHMMQAVGRLWLTDLMGLGDTEKSDRSLSTSLKSLCRGWFIWLGDLGVCCEVCSSLGSRGGRPSQETRSFKASPHEPNCFQGIGLATHKVLIGCPNFKMEWTCRTNAKHCKAQWSESKKCPANLDGQRRGWRWWRWKWHEQEWLGTSRRKMEKMQGKPTLFRRDQARWRPLQVSIQWQVLATIPGMQLCSCEMPRVRSWTHMTTHMTPLWQPKSKNFSPFDLPNAQTFRILSFWSMAISWQIDQMFQVGDTLTRRASSSSLFDETWQLYHLSEFHLLHFMGNFREQSFAFTLLLTCGHVGDEKPRQVNAIYLTYAFSNLLVMFCYT